MNNHYFFERAFRPFFLGGITFAVIAMFIWWLQTQNDTGLFTQLSSNHWHGHEMIFGYALATVTGFLLTAVMNWSGMNSASGWPLAAAFILWCFARLGFLLSFPIEWIAFFDLGFNLLLVGLFAWPVFQKSLWAQTGLLSKFILLFAVNALFYAQWLGWQPSAIWGWQLTLSNTVLMGLFLIIAINLTMIRRTLPFFTEKTLQLAPISETPWLNRLAMIGLIGVLVSAIIAPTHWITSIIALPTALAFALRGKHWHHLKIWQAPLLWPLHLSYAFTTLGIALYALVGLHVIPATYAIHSLTVGGIGLLCSAMVARISLGHTHRNVFNPPKGLKWVFISLAGAAFFRVIMPLLTPELLSVWIQISQWGWILGFGLLWLLYWRILSQPSPRNPHNLF